MEKVAFKKIRIGIRRYLQSIEIDDSNMSDKEIDAMFEALLKADFGYFHNPKTKLGVK